MLRKIVATNATGVNYYLSLEILRGLCALEVVIWHCFARVDDLFLSASPTFEFIYYSFLRGSNIAVISFFVLSGFVTSASFVSYFNKYGALKASILFYIARMIRIWPLTFTTVLVSVAVAWHYRTMSGNWTHWSRYSDFDFRNIVKSALGLSQHWNAPLWTLSYEIAFYCILPCAMLVILRTQYITKFISALALGIISYRLLHSDLIPFSDLYVPFALGMLIYLTKDSIFFAAFFSVQ